MPSLFDLFSDETTMTVFETVINKKRTDLRTIRESLKMPEDKATKVLDWLEKEGLLERVASPVPDFSVYFASPKGLAASRQLNASRRLAKTLS
jgi:DNA-binding MarR family transcriptional regulator